MSVILEIKILPNLILMYRYKSFAKYYYYFRNKGFIRLSPFIIVDHHITFIICQIVTATATAIYVYTVSPNKHGNSVTIFNLSTFAQLGCKINLLRGCVPASQAEVD